MTAKRALKIVFAIALFGIRSVRVRDSLRSPAGDVPCAMKARAPGLVLAIVVGAWSADARANCAMPITYYVSVAGSTVTICPANLEGRGCPDPDGMLRVSATETIKVADRCSGDAGPDSCYVDECVPPGYYEYGFAKPYDCCEYCCGTYYYATARVVDDLPSRCSPPDAGGGTNGGDADVPGTSVSPPYWSTSDQICGYSGPGTGGRAGSGGQGGTGGGAGYGGSGQAGAAIDTDDGDAASNGGCSCVTAGRPSTTELVLGANGLLVSLGLLLGRRRHAA